MTFDGTPGDDLQFCTAAILSRMEFMHQEEICFPLSFLAPAARDLVLVSCFTRPKESDPILITDAGAQAPTEIPL